MMKFFAIVALAMFATTNATTAVTAASVTRTSLVQGVAPGDVVLTFTATTEVGNGGIITFTPAAANEIFTADSTSLTTCASTSTANTAAIAASAANAAQAANTLAITGTGTAQILTITLASASATYDKFTAGDVVVFTCTGNLKVNPAALTALTFDVKTSTDATVVAATGYTTTAGFKDFTATRASLVTGVAPGNLVVTLTPLVLIGATSGTITLTPSSNIFDADGAGTTCAVVITGDSTTAPTMTAAVSLTASAQKVILTMGTGVTDTIAVDEVATITCTGNMAAVNGAAASTVKFSVTTSGDSTGLTAAQAGGYLIASASAASATAGVSMLTMLALAGVAMRQ